MPSKYHNRKTWRILPIDGILFDSRREAEYYDELKLREKAGEITDLQLQVKFSIDINGKHICNYFADFVYWEYESLTAPDPTHYAKVLIIAPKEAKKQKRKVVVDVKGMRTDVYRLKKKLVEAVYGIEITEVK